MNLPTLPVKTHEEALKLKQTVYDFVPQQYHKNIEFSFQIFRPNETPKEKKTLDAIQSKKYKGWRVGFSTFAIDDTNNFVSVPEIAENFEPGRGNLTSHTHLTRNREKEDIETIKELKVQKRSSDETLYLKFGYIYIHWKLLLPNDTPRHKWDTEKIKIAKNQPIIQAIYVGESGVAGVSNFFERSTKARSSDILDHKLNWKDEVVYGYVVWIINGLSTEWRLKLETHLIEFYGRADLGKGPLVNRTNGGQHNRGRLQGSPRNAPETVKKISDAAYKREETISEETKANRSQKISESRTGIKFSEERKAAISEARRGVPKDRIHCEHCNEEFAPTPFGRYHGDNCAARPGLSNVRDEQGNLLSWSEANEKKHKAINQDNNKKREESREIVAKWVRKECANKSPNQKLKTLKFWKKVRKQPNRTSRWYTVAFQQAGQWYSIDETLARRKIIENQENQNNSEDTAPSC